MTRASDLASREIVRVDSFEGMFDALEDPVVNASIYSGERFAHQLALENYNKRGKSAYIVIGSPLDQFADKVERHLGPRGLGDRTVLESFATFLAGITERFVRLKGVAEGEWDVTLASTLLHHTAQREWHIDSYDANGRTYQITLTCAGEPGTILSVTSDYDRAGFERIRDARREREIQHQKDQRALNAAGFGWLKRRREAKRLKAAIDADRASNVRLMEDVLRNMQGVPTSARDIVLFKGGNVPHTSPVRDERRLIFTLVEFDEFMDSSLAERTY